MQDKLVEETMKIINELKKEILEKEEKLNELIKEYQEIADIELDEDLNS